MVKNVGVEVARFEAADVQEIVAASAAVHGLVVFNHIFLVGILFL